MSFINPLKVLEIVNSHKDWLDWEPETIWHDIGSEFITDNTHQEVPRILKDIIMAIRLCLTNNSPWMHWNVFDKVVMTFNNTIPNFQVMQMPSLGQIALGVAVMNKIKANIFDEEIQNYVALVAREEGYILLPDSLQFAQEMLNKHSNGMQAQKNGVALAWKALKVNNTLGIESDDNVISVQVAKLLAIDKYVKQNLPDK